LRWVITTLILLTFISQTHAKPKKYKYTNYQGRVTKIVDGDTVKAVAFLSPYIDWKTTVRLRGIDTPEIRGKCPAEKRMAKAAKAYLNSFLKVGDAIELRRVRKGKYAGRIIASLYYKENQRWVNVSKKLLNAGYGRPYNGGKRKGWCR
jgi:endonuclease YncB( thermonuclease family)